MPNPTVSLLDDFNRADANPIPGYTVFDTVDGNIQLVSNQAVNGTPGPSFWSGGWNATQFGADQEIAVTIPTTGTGVNLYLCQPVLNSATKQNYSAKLTFGSTVLLRRSDAGVSTTIGSTALTFSNGDKAWLSRRGSTLELYRYTGGAWSSILSATDSTYFVSGYLGFGIYASTVVDDFYGGTVVETGPAVAGTFVGGADIISGPTYGAFQVNAFQNDAFQIYNTGGASYNETGAGVAGTFAAGADRRSLSESGAGVAGVVASGADRRSLSESGAAVGGNVAAGAERFTWVETAAGIAGVFAAGLETVTLSDGGYGLAGVLASGAEQFTGGAVTYNETGAGVAGAEAYVTDAAALVESGYSIAGAAVFGADAWTMTDTGAALVGGAAYGSDAATSSESGAGLLGAIAAGADAYTMGDSGYGLAGAVAAGADLMVLAGPAARAELVRQFGAVVADDDTAARAPAARVQQSSAAARGKGSKVA